MKSFMLGVITTFTIMYLLSYISILIDKKNEKDKKNKKRGK